MGWHGKPRSGLAHSGGSGDSEELRAHVGAPRDSPSKELSRAEREGGAPGAWGPPQGVSRREGPVIFDPPGAQRAGWPSVGVAEAACSVSSREQEMGRGRSSESGAGDSPRGAQLSGGREEWWGATIFPPRRRQCKS